MTINHQFWYSFKCCHVAPQTFISRLVVIGYFNVTTDDTAVVTISVITQFRVSVRQHVFKWWKGFFVAVKLTKHLTGVADSNCLHSFVANHRYTFAWLCTGIQTKLLGQTVRPVNLYLAVVGISWCKLKYVTRKCGLISNSKWILFFSSNSVHFLGICRWQRAACESAAFSKTITNCILGGYRPCNVWLSASSCAV